MKALIQRVIEAEVYVDETRVSCIGKGLLVFLGVEHGDSEQIVQKMTKKVCAMRIFEDEDNKMNRSIKDIQGEVLLVSQFTLAADLSSGNRPSFTGAAAPEKARMLYDYFAESVKQDAIVCKQGRFGANMQVKLINDGPATFYIHLT